jgi:drug/metabolite transporter (DMT)-like permease
VTPGPIGSKTGDETGRYGLPGIAVAALTALISGVSVFVNSYGVHSISEPSVYTTAKNIVATFVLGVIAMLAWGLHHRRAASAGGRFVTVTRASGSEGVASGWRAWGPAGWVGLGYVGIVGGGIAFVLFFNGLAKTSAAPAAFWRDTLVVWVAVLAVPFLHERLKWWNLAAIALLIVGQITIERGVGHLTADRGEVLVLAATLLWAVEVVVAKVLLRDLAPAAVSIARMGIGAITLVVYLAATGSLGTLLSLDAEQVGWALLTGVLLAAYVGTWMTALARTRAIDVTSVLVGSALVTALLQAMAGTTSLAPQALGLALIVVGAGVVLWVGLRRPAMENRSVAAG